MTDPITAEPSTSTSVSASGSASLPSRNHRHDAFYAGISTDSATYERAPPIVLNQTNTGPSHGLPAELNVAPGAPKTVTKDPVKKQSRLHDRIDRLFHGGRKGELRQDVETVKKDVEEVKISLDTITAALERIEQAQKPQPREDIQVLKKHRRRYDYIMQIAREQQNWEKDDTWRRIAITEKVPGKMQNWDLDSEDGEEEK